ncbi:MFS transporter [Anaeromyxobacter paludicola]|uniref:MFS transporter n=1 Tax=Anaeromyxobacter paludicola TaxID=2918171 RepID=A0ABN6NBJ4_9BACT|nr:MFS transporter [Anaeromyxobacter paludicola]BDG09375.1 MFS transporter [Anaeromyxobacter paludicola]
MSRTDEDPPPLPARRDVALLLATRALRLFAYGLLSVGLVLHLAAAGLSELRIGLLLTLTLLGDTAVSLALTTHADRAGRRRTLLAGAALMVLAGAVFSATRSFWLLLAAATVGVVSPAGNEVGPFLAVEQAALAQAVPAGRRTQVFAWYQLAGAGATALGALAGGAAAGALQRAGLSALASYRALTLAYAALGLALAACFARLSPAAEAPRGPARAGLRARLGLHRSRGVVLRLSALFSVDAFAGGFVVQAFVAWWFHRRFGADPALLGRIFFGANALAGLSALSASWVAARIGLVRTMVFTHLPSNLLLLAVPLMPTLPLAVAVLFLRFSISQMDVPTRQSYTMAVVEPDERSAAAGVTGIARTVGAALSPVVAGPLYASPALAGLPFLLAGALKIIYDLALFAAFRRHPAPEERREAAARPGPASRQADR